MAISYTEALAILEIAAQEIGGTFCRKPELVPTLDAARRIASTNVYSPTQTPVADSSAMDGYAVASVCTRGASIDRPVVLRVQGIIAAGDTGIRRFRDGVSLAALGRDGNVMMDAATNGGRDVDQFDLISTSEFGDTTTLSEVDIPPCIEIVRGAQFPPAFVDGAKQWVFDAFVRLEDVAPLPSAYSDGTRLVQVVKPVLPNSHRRHAGEDFAKGDLVVRKGETLRSQHIMALASLGMREIQVFRTLSVAILSTGEEVVSHYAATDDHSVRDANGPFLETALHSLGASVRFWGVVGDDREQFAKIVSDRLRCEEVDVLISTGAVSMGRFDFVEAALAELGGSARFHRASHTLWCHPTRQKLDAQRTQR